MKETPKKRNSDRLPVSQDSKRLDSYENIQSLIRDNYDDFSKRLQEVASYLLDNTNSVAFDTIAEISEKTDIPASTFIRFSNALGFKGFNEIKVIYREQVLKENMSYIERAKLFKHVGEYSEDPLVILQECVHANKQALKQLSAKTESKKLLNAKSLIKEASTVYILGLGRSFSIASYLFYALCHSGKRVILIEGLGALYKELINGISDKDLLISISFSPYAKEAIELVEYANLFAVKQLSITDSQVSPVITFADEYFIINEAQVGGIRSQTATFSLLQALILLVAQGD